MLLLVMLILHSVLTAGIPVQGKFEGPTEQLIKRESWERIEKKLDKMKIPQKLYPFFDSIASHEDWGHIGYHGSSQGYRVYQDVIRFTIEEILKIPIYDFHFLRIPGDPDYNFNSMDDFYEYWGKIDNKNDKRAKQLLSLNFGIYSNFDNEGSCSLNLFVKDKSKTSINYVKQLVPFFDELGIPPGALEDLFAIARKSLDEDGGILLQLSETSHVDDPKGEAYNFADMLGYPSKRGGYVYGSYPLSNHFERIRTDLYIEHKLDIAPQLRLLINNCYTLNPFSYLRVKRWDLYDPETIASYEDEMRAYIRTLSFDPVKAEIYRKFLLDLWQSIEI